MADMSDTGGATTGAISATDVANPPNLRITSLSKSFGGVRALDGVDLTVPAGQVHALLGHNGAGKSTLIKCLGGAFPPDAGTIGVGGVPYTRLSPRESIAAGVAIIFQTLSVVDSLTVAENIFLGQEWTRYGRIDRRAQEKVAAELLDRVAASCSPRDRVGELPMGQKQLVEIAKALSRSASVLVLDEPTAALSGTESDALAARVEDLRAQGLAIVYVTHLLAEVERLADAVTVLRDGRVAHHSATGVTIAGSWWRRSRVDGEPCRRVPPGPGRPLLVPRRAGRRPLRVTVAVTVALRVPPSVRPPRPSGPPAERTTTPPVTGNTAPPGPATAKTASPRKRKRKRTIAPGDPSPPPPGPWRPPPPAHPSPPVSPCVVCAAPASDRST